MRTLIMLIAAAAAAAAQTQEVQTQDLAAVRGQILNHAAQVRALHQEKELLLLQNEIAKLRQECLRQGYTCAGGKLREIARQTAASPDDSGASGGAAAGGAPEAEFDLVGVVGGRARIARHGGGAGEYREGDAIGGWRLETIELDRVHLARDGGRRTLYIIRQARRDDTDEPKS